MLRIGIILGSTRPGRNGEAVAQRVHQIAAQRSDAQFEMVDLADWELPLSTICCCPATAATAAP